MFSLLSTSIFRSSALALVCTLTAWSASSAALAQGVCESVMNTCSDNDDQCFETLYACGKYKLILGSFTGELKDLGLKKQYLSGIAYLGLAEGERAQSLKCSYTAYGKTTLISFLSRAQDNYQKTGSFGDANLMRYVYNATKLLHVAKQLQGCLEDGHSQGSINAYAKEYAEAGLKGLFIGGLETDKELQQPFNLLMDDLRGLVSVASNVETKLALSRFEIEAADKQLLAIQDDLSTYIGEIGESGATSQFAAISDRLGSSSDINSPLGIVASKEKEFSEFWQGCENRQTPGDPAPASQSCADAFAKNKENAINQAKQLKQSATVFSRFAESQFKFGPNFQRFINLKTENDQERSISDMARRTKSLWKNYGITKKICQEPNKSYWYCSAPSAQETQK